ncbi:MAG: single-stranded DNA-binding protein [Chitinophagaceae bacterium]|nr:single-stranded DNA-binding protein [Chitinophagaceae bacterium]
MRGINKVILLGNAGKDPEFKTLNDGTTVARFSLATTDYFTLKNGEAGSKTEWHTIVAWKSLANLIQKYVRKGSLLYIEGKLSYRQYEDKDGRKMNITEIVVENIVLLDKKNTGVEE